MIKVYKYLNDLSPDIMNTIFKLKKKYLEPEIFECQNRKTKKFGLDSIAYRAT